MANTKPILFVCSSSEFSKVDLSYSGRVLNLERELTDAEIQSFNGEYIIVNACKDVELQKLRLVNLDSCVRVAVLRARESVKSEWINNFKYEYIIKLNQVESLKNAKTKADILNYVKFLDMSKKRPESDFKFIWNKIKAVVPFLGAVFSKYAN